MNRIGMGRLAYPLKSTIQLADKRMVTTKVAYSIPVETGSVRAKLVMLGCPSLPTGMLIGKQGMKKLGLGDKLDQILYDENRKLYDKCRGEAAQLESSDSDFRQSRRLQRRS